MWKDGEENFKPHIFFFFFVGGGGSFQNFNEHSVHFF